MKQLTLLFLFFASSALAVCPSHLLTCGDACYSSNQYCCVNNLLVQIQFCSPSPPTCSQRCGTQSCCLTPQGTTCYDPSVHSCVRDDLGNDYVCPVGLSSCGFACFDPQIYNCFGGNLLLKTTPAPTSAPTLAPTPAPSQNLIQNPGFESGNLGNWVEVGGYHYDGSPFGVSNWRVESGSYNFAFTASGQWHTVEQSFNASPNQNMTLSYWMKGGQYGSHNVQLFSVEFNGQYLFRQNNGHPSGNNKYTFQVQGSESGSNTIKFGTNSDGDNFFLDDVFLG